MQPSDPDLTPLVTPDPTVPAVTPAPAPAPSPVGQVVSGGFDPAASVLPGGPQPVTPQATVAPQAYVGSFDAPPGAANVTQAPLQTTEPIANTGRRRILKPLLISLAVLVVIGGGSATAYFGYYMNSSVIYGQALKNTGKGYDRLITYLDDQAKLNYKGVVASGSYTFGSGSFASDGKLTFNSNKDDSDTTADLNMGSGRLSIDVRDIKNKTAIPDIYFKVDGLDTLSGLTQGLGLGTQINSLDNQWIVIDHSLFDSLQKGTSSSSSPTHDQVLDAAHAFGQVNKQYVFTTDKNKAVLTVVKKYGLATVDGHKTYRYQVALNKSNVKKYITAQRDALKASKLGGWIKQNNYENDLDLAYDSMQQSADNINPKNTFDLWADVNTRVMYKVRFTDQSNPGSSYTDVGLDYKGGSDYPFFISSYSKSGGNTDTGSFIADLNTKTHVTNLKVNFKSTGSTASNFNGNASVKQTNDVAPINTPTGAKPIMQVLNELGLGSTYQNLSTGGNTSSSTSSPLTLQN